MKTEKITAPNGQEITEYYLDNGQMTVTILDLGATITRILVPDKNGRKENVTLRYKNIEDYQENKTYFGALVGRTAGRLPGGRLIVGGNEYQIFQNAGENALHGGAEGFSRKLWKLEAYTGTKLSLSYTSPDGEEGYPGRLEVSVVYALSQDNSLDISYRAKSDRDSAVNLTNHAYFNLSGSAANPVFDHVLTLYNKAVLETDENMTASGKAIPTKGGTAFDLTEAKLVEEVNGGAIDACFLLEEGRAVQAIVEHPASGRRIEVRSDQPAITVYTDSSSPADGKILEDGGAHARFSGLCLEAQKPNVGLDGSFYDQLFLKAGEIYTQSTSYKFVF
ncbi:MAG: galactose mutarotase [Oscillospiraceae bacterium]|jgi:aldose 1-epimerase|nr:galactose mutarotase [Oscillospiraceae bacterium]